jgi:uncharacterized protein YlxW (UPF0749 family)
MPFTVSAPVLSERQPVVQTSTAPMASDATLFEYPALERSQAIKDEPTTLSAQITRLDKTLSDYKQFTLDQERKHKEERIDTLRKILPSQRNNILLNGGLAAISGAVLAVQTLAAGGGGIASLALTAILPVVFGVQTYQAWANYKMTQERIQDLNQSLRVVSAEANPAWSAFA